MDAPIGIPYTNFYSTTPNSFRYPCIYYWTWERSPSFQFQSSKAHEVARGLLFFALVCNSQLAPGEHAEDSFLAFHAFGEGQQAITVNA